MELRKIDSSPRHPTRTRPTLRPESVTTPELLEPSAELTATQVAYDRAVRRFGAVPGAQIQVCVSPGSSNRPVISLRHVEGRVERFRVQTHFHGDQFMDTQADYDGNIGKSVAAAWEKNRDWVVVLPEAANEDAAPRSDWANITDVAKLTRDALISLQLDPAKAGHVTVSGHSAGGSVIAHAIAKGDNASPLGIRKADRIELYDCAVGSAHNPVSEKDRKALESWCHGNETKFILVPGIMKTSWLDYIDRSRWTAKHDDHWTPVWQSLGQELEPKPRG